LSLLNLVFPARPPHYTLHCAPANAFKKIFSGPSLGILRGVISPASSPQILAPLVLALDIGTSSTRALLFDARGHKIGTATQHPYDNATTPDGGVFTEAESLLDLTVRCIDEIYGRLEDEVGGGQVLGQVLAVACSCFWHSIVAVDSDGRALSPVFSWADNRAAPWVGPLRALLDEDEAHARTGCVFHPSYWPAKLLWLQATHPELFTPQTRWMSFGEYLLARLCSENEFAPRASVCMASGTGLFNQNALAWDPQVLAALPIGESQLSPLCDSGEPVGVLASTWAARWPMLKGAKWFPALGDGACSNVGSGGVDAGAIVLNCGTSGALRIVLENWTQPAPRGLWRYRVDSRRSVLGGALSNAGNVLAWARKNLHLPPNWDALVAQNRKTNEPHGLSALPFLAGERSPLWNARARLVVEGATLDTSPIEVLQVLLEGASLRFKAVGDALRASMRESGLNAEVPILFSGGALDASPAWAQIMADCLGAPLIESHEKEGSARGAALLALEACGVIGSIGDLPAERGRQVLPDATQSEYFTRALAKQEALYEHLYGVAKAG
jgi:gluconokinase